MLIDENAASMAEALEKLLSQPGAMRSIGEGAQRELYISWEDAVARAFERYGTVIENYRAGAYGGRERDGADLYAALGEVIDRYNLAREYQRLLRENAVLNYAGVRTGIEEEVERMRAQQAEDTAVAAMKLEDLRRRVECARVRVLTGRQLLLADAENLRADLRRRLQSMMDDILRPNDRFL